LFVVKEKDLLKEYREKEPMITAKEKEHEPTTYIEKSLKRLQKEEKKYLILKEQKNELEEVVRQKKLLVLLKLVMNMNKVLLDQTNR